MMSYTANYKICSGFDEEYDGTWVTKINVEIVFDEDEMESIAAKAQFYFVDLESAVNRGLDPGYIFDLDAEIHPYYERLYEENQLVDFNDDVQDMFGHNLSSLNLFIIHRVEILPLYRSRKLMEKILNDAIRLSSGTAQLIVLKPYPLQFESELSKHYSHWERKMKLQSFDSNREKACLNLKKYYIDLGFKPVGSAGVMAKIKQ